MCKLFLKTRYKLVKMLDLELRSLRAAARQQGLTEIGERLATIIPDLSAQYTDQQLACEPQLTQTRLLQAFQIRLVLQAFRMLTQPRVLVDIGDSAGTHIRYLRRPTNAEFRAISVNVDPIAVNRIRSQGMEAYCCSAEDIARVGAEADFFLLFETLEHLLSPAEFLHELSRLPSCRCLVLSVPWVRHSRLGLQHLRHPGALATPETTHMFELAPSDLRLLFRHCGWRLLHSELYYQYPRWHPLMVMRGFWRDHDFEGFYGAVLQPDSSGSELYTGWEKRPAQHSG